MNKMRILTRIETIKNNQILELKNTIELKISLEVFNSLLDQAEA